MRRERNKDTPQLCQFKKTKKRPILNLIYNLGQRRAVIRALAKLHGASWAWACDLGGEDKVKEKYPILFEEFMDSKAGFEVMETMVGNTIKTMAVLVEVIYKGALDFRKDAFTLLFGLELKR